MKIRYEIETGKVNLFTTGDEEIDITGCKYMTVPERPHFDDTREWLYVQDGKVIAVPAPDEAEEQLASEEEEERSSA